MGDFPAEGFGLRTSPERRYHGGNNDGEGVHLDAAGHRARRSTNEHQPRIYQLGEVLRLAEIYQGESGADTSKCQ